MSSSNNNKSRGGDGGGGKRTGVTVAAKKGRGISSVNTNNEMEDMDDMWERARSPQASAEQTQEEPTKTAKKQKIHQKKSVLKKKTRYTLPGINKVAVASTDDDDNKKRSAFVPINNKYLPKAIRNSAAAAVVASPSELSSVATLPPSPRSAEKTPKQTVPDEEEEEELSHHAVEKSDDDNDDDNDDVGQKDPNVNDDNHSNEEGVVEEEDFGHAGFEQEDQSTATPVASVVEDPPPDVQDNEPNDEEELDQFPVNDDDDDDDDIVPPPPPNTDDGDEDDESKSDQEPEAKPETAISDPEEQDDEHQDDADGDDDDDDGGSFDMVPANPETPESARLVGDEEEEREPEASTSSKKKKKKKQKPGRPRKTNTDDASVAVTPTPRPKRGKRKGAKQVTFFPQGMQSGPREFEQIPISKLKEDEEEAPINARTNEPCRRSGRAKVKPLKFWLGEKQVLSKHKETGDLKEAMGCMPTVSHIQKSKPTPRKKRKAPPITENHVSKRGKAAPAFDSKKLRRRNEIIDGEEADVWTDALEEVEQLNVIARSKKMEPNVLPRVKRRKGEGDVRGSAAQAFNLETDKKGRYVGYIMGQLFLPPGGIKDPESVGACAQLFTVCAGQEGSIQFAYSDPDENEGVFNPSTAQRFLVGPHDQIRVPPGNCYRIQNHSTTTEAILAWVIIRPCQVENE